MQSGIEQHEPCRQHARIGLKPAYQHALDLQGAQVGDQLGRRQISVLYEHLVGRD